MELKYFELAHKLNEGYMELLIDNEVHFRASLNSISLISISIDKPELGIKCNSAKYNAPANLKHTIEEDIKKVQALNSPHRSTPEKKLQSWIIKYALTNNLSLPFDTDIKFITSELAVKGISGMKIVTDILGYNETKQQLYVIELKSDRLLKRLIQQVSTFEAVILENPRFFSQLLFIHGFTNQLDFLKNLKKVIVWPAGNSSPNVDLKRKGILEITYRGFYKFTTLS